jgi:hypothetical protein
MIPLIYCESELPSRCPDRQVEISAQTLQEPIHDRCDHGTGFVLHRTVPVNDSAAIN